jgi:hypothetical protein
MKMNNAVFLFVKQQIPVFVLAECQINHYSYFLFVFFLHLSNVRLEIIIVSFSFLIQLNKYIQLFNFQILIFFCIKLRKRISSREKKDYLLVFFSFVDVCYDYNKSWLHFHSQRQRKYCFYSQ